MKSHIFVNLFLVFDYWYEINGTAGIHYFYSLIWHIMIDNRGNSLLCIDLHFVVLIWLKSSPYENNRNLHKTFFAVACFMQSSILCIESLLLSASTEKHFQQMIQLISWYSKLLRMSSFAFLGSFVTICEIHVTSFSFHHSGVTEH